MYAVKVIKANEGGETNVRAKQAEIFLELLYAEMSH